MTKNIKDLEFNDIGFVEKGNRKALILFGKTKEKAQNLFNELKKGFNLKHRVEKSGTYTVGVDIPSYNQTATLETSLKKEAYPQLVWLDNSNVTDLMVAYKVGDKIELIEPSFPLGTHTSELKKLKSEDSFSGR